MNRLRVAVGISGGVDSAVAAWLLKKKGFDVVGVYMINWDPVEEGSATCPRTKDEADARHVCEKINIPFSTVNFVKEYWNDVFVTMLENYRRGRTVVPDIACNRHIKFDRLHRHAIDELGADLVATGHYASTSYGDFQEKRQPESSTLNQEQLKRALFPLGSFTKTEVRRIAREQGLHEIAEKPESMGICFVGKRKNFEDFLDQYIEPCPGEILTLDGRHIGHHEDTDETTLECRIQRTHQPIRCHVKRIGQSLLSIKPVCVFYDGRECLGGGEVRNIISTLKY
ncbi:tRNA methyl transferase [Ostertagia ostertagi]